MCDFACVLSDIDAKLNDVAGQNLAGWTLLRAATQSLAVDECPVAAFSVLQVELASFVVKPNQGMIPGQHLAVKGGVVLGRATPSHRPADLDWLIQVYMTLLEWMRVGSAGKHSQR